MKDQSEEDGKWDRELQREVRSAERNRRTKFGERQTQDRWDVPKERSQETDTQIETWRQTLRDRVKPAKRQERQRAPSPQDHTAAACL